MIYREQLSEEELIAGMDDDPEEQLVQLGELAMS